MIKAVSLISVLILLATASMAQQYSQPYEYATSSAPAATTFFDFDLVDTLYMNMAASHRVIYRDFSATSWDSAEINLTYQACSTQTYSGSINFQPPSGTLEWYFRSVTDTAVVSQSPKNETDQFPVPQYLLADLGADLTGDQNGGGSNLDITHLFGSYSDSKLYLRLDNNGSGFPTSGGLFTYYLYMVGLLDPNATDSTVYLMLYGNAVLYSTGLYAMDLADSSLTQIGSITTNVSGNSLSLSCNISDLTSQPGWSDWPPPSGFIGAAPITATLSLTTLATNDDGKAALFIPSSHLLNFSAANSAPQLGGPSVSSDAIGHVSATITYTDSDNDLPVTRNFIFADVPYEMTACEKDYIVGSVFKTELDVTETGWYKYSFEFSDGADAATTPLDSIYIDLGNFTCGDVNADGDINLIDILYVIDNIYGDPVGPAPDPPESGDVNSDGDINLIDILYLISFIYDDPPGPDPVCP